jgi:hypothetical protein
MSRVYLLVGLGLAACGDPEVVPDAAEALPPDASDICGAAATWFKGEYLDWDSTTAMFAGIKNATFTLAEDTTHVAHTLSNGRFELCASDATEFLVDIVPPATKHYIGGTVVATKDATGADATISLRAFTKERGEGGPFAFDTSKAQVYVVVLGQARAVEVSGIHGSPFQWTGTQWRSGATGTHVYFPNVDPSGGSTKVSIPNASPISLIPIAAGQFTYVIVAAK